MPSTDYSVICILGSDNDRIGNLIKFYNPVDYGKGAHTNVVSSTGNFTLRYTTTVTPPPITAVNKQLDPNTFLNQTQQNNIFASNETK